MSNSKNQELYTFLEEADRNGSISWTLDTSDIDEQIINRGINLGFLCKISNSNIRLTENGQKVVDANGDFSVVEEKPIISVVAENGSSVFVGNNYGHFNQSSSNETNKYEIDNPVNTPKKNNNAIAWTMLIIAIITIAVMVYLDYN